MSDIQEQVQETLDELVASGAELGVQAVAYRDGIKVVDTVAGVVAPDGPPVTPGTVFYNFSIGKGAMSTLVHQEVDRAPSDTTRPSWSCGRSSVPTARRASRYAMC
jgi:CubicO group peptidase (beta-lactamase class C family)